MSRGLRNNNYLNIKGRGWRGQTGQDSRGHAVFSSPEWGVRAAIVLLRTYWFRYGLRTIGAILSRWAPVSDTVGSLPGGPKNSPREYSLFVSRRMSFPPNSGLSLFHDDEDRTVNDVRQLKSLVEAMTTYEIGGGFDLPDQIFERALYLI